MRSIPMFTYLANNSKYYEKNGPYYGSWRMSHYTLQYISTGKIVTY